MHTAKSLRPVLGAIESLRLWPDAEEGSGPLPAYATSIGLSIELLIAPVLTGRPRLEVELKSPDLPYTVTEMRCLSKVTTAQAVNIDLAFPCARRKSAYRSSM
jgi:hypothetical protein